MPVAETFTFVDEAGHSLSSVSRLDSLVTVVDALNFWQDYETYDDLADRKMGIDDDDHRNIVDLLIDQIEFANVVILNKCDLVDPAQLVALEGFVRQLNSTGTILKSQFGQVPLKEILGTEPFSDDMGRGTSRLADGSARSGNERKRRVWILVIPVSGTEAFPSHSIVGCDGLTGRGAR